VRCRNLTGGGTVLPRDIWKRSREGCKKMSKGEAERPLEGEAGKKDGQDRRWERNSDKKQEDLLTRG
jgi:hypothetical protein